MTASTKLYLAIASHHDRVVAYASLPSYESARAWCERARDCLFEHVDQILIASLKQSAWPHAGQIAMLVPVCGWVRVGRQWQVPEASTIRLSFTDLPSAPTPIDALKPLREPAASWTSPLDYELRMIAVLLARLSQSFRALAGLLHPMTTRRKRVLLVDDDPVARKIAKQALIDHDVVEADGFAAALLELAHGDFDVIVTDHEMGALGTGIDLLSEIRERWPRMRRVLCTGNVEQLKVAVGAGVAQHVLQKPFDREALLAAIPMR